MINIRDLKKNYGNQVVLDGIDVEIPRGETLALLGSSGSGKSTLLRCINRLEIADSGQIFFEGEEISVIFVFSLLMHIPLCAGHFAHQPS